MNTSNNQNNELILSGASIVKQITNSNLNENRDNEVEIQDYEDSTFTYFVGGAICSGPSIYDGEAVIKNFVQSVVLANREQNNPDYVRYCTPKGFVIPKEWINEIRVK